jgi:hypothetical protein
MSILFFIHRTLPGLQLIMAQPEINRPMMLFQYREAIWNLFDREAGSDSGKISALTQQIYYHYLPGIRYDSFDFGVARDFWASPMPLLHLVLFKKKRVLY